jgi:hypothetical protein
VITVRDLIEALKFKDQDAIVVVYSQLDEGFDFAHDVTVQSRDNPDDWLYTKSDHPFDEKYGWVDEDIEILVAVR